MASRYPRYKAGDPFTPSIINFLMAELERWSNLVGDGGVDVSYADDVGGGPPVITGRFDDGRARIWMPTGIAAGTFGSPATKTDVILAVPSGHGWTTTGGTTITLYNCDTVGVTGAKAGWAVPGAGGDWELLLADC
jgi:hypothetical protein